MARLTDDKAIEAIRPHLRGGEQLQNHAYGVRMPHPALIVGLIVLAVIPGVIAAVLLSKNYLVALTDRRFIVLRLKGRKPEVVEVREYDRKALPPVETKTRRMFTRIRLKDQQQPFSADFNRMAMKENRRHAMEIEAALTGAAV